MTISKFFPVFCVLVLACAPLSGAQGESAHPSITFRTDDTSGALGTWWWNCNLIKNPDIRASRLDFLQQNQVTEIYFCIGNSVTDEEVKDFIRDCGRRGIRVACLGGDAIWIMEENETYDAWYARFRQYQQNAAEDEKFYGVHLDVEPHQLSAYSKNADLCWQLYAQYVKKAADMAHQDGTLIELDIPFWLDDFKVTMDEKEWDLLNYLTRTVDTITLMSYRDTARAMISVSNKEIMLAHRNNCRVVLGAETYSEEGDAVSYMEEGKAYMYEELAKVYQDISARKPSGGFGLAIHYVENWYKLKD